MEQSATAAVAGPSGTAGLLLLNSSSTLQLICSCMDAAKSQAGSAKHVAVVRDGQLRAKKSARARARENIPCPPLLHLSAVQLEVGIAEIF
jgi:hypothetical protein